MAKELKVRWIILVAGIILYAGVITLVRMTAVDNEIKFLIFLAVYLEAVLVDRTKRTIEKYIDICPAYAIRKGGEQERQVEELSGYGMKAKYEGKNIMHIRN